MNNQRKTRIAIMGAGSIGCYLGACLSASDANICLIGRQRIQQQLSEFDLRATDWKGRDQSIAYAQLNFSCSDESLSDADYILLTVKSGDTEQAAKAILTHAKPSAVIISFQNGTKNVAVLQRILPKQQIVKAMVPFNVLNNGQGLFHCGTEGNLAIEVKKHEHLTLLSAFEQAELPVNLHDDLSGIQWGKLLMNLNNSINALSGIPLLDQLNNREYRKVMTQVIQEALFVMDAAGIVPARTGKVIPRLMPHILSLPNWLFKRVASATLKIDPKARSSMYEDFVLKRKTEIDFLNGEIVNLAVQQGLAAPVNKTIVRLVKDAEAAMQGSPMLSADYIQKAINSAR